MKGLLGLVVGAAVVGGAAYFAVKYLKEREILFCKHKEDDDDLWEPREDDCCDCCCTDDECAPEEEKTEE